MTYSVVARCTRTGQFGVATQSHWFAVGTLVPWLRTDVGVVATQALSDVSYGPLGLDRLMAGERPEDALQLLLSEDEQRECRQVAMLNAQGEVAAFTGSKCVDHSGQVVLDDAAFVANCMAGPGVPEAMATAWVRTVDQSLARRLLGVLDAAAVAGGDLRGQQSAALRVTTPDKGSWWERVNVDLRVDDHATPVAELARLLDLREAYTDADFAEAAGSHGDFQEMETRYRRARSVLPNSPELAFWHGVALARLGDIVGARNALAVAYAAGPQWNTLFERVAKAGQIVLAPATVEALR